MIEYSLLAASAFNIMLPFIIKGGEELSSNIASDLWKTITGVFKSKNEERVIELLQQNPTDARVQGKAEYILEKELENNPDLATSLQGLIENIKSSEEYKNMITQKGDNNIAIAGKFNNSNIKITNPNNS